MEGKIFPNSSWPHTENHHVCHTDGSDSHSPSPSTGRRNNCPNFSGVAPYPSNISALFEIRLSATFGGAKLRPQGAGDVTAM